VTHCRKENLTHFAVTVVSKDRPGIVADVTEVLYHLGCNIEDSSCTMLGGDFAMILIVSHEFPFGMEDIETAFGRLHERTGLVIHIRHLEESEVCPIEQHGELCLISVYGSDRPGIVYRVTRTLADRGVNITDLNTRLIGTVDEPVYVLMLEAVLPPPLSISEVEGLLASLKDDLSVEIGVRPITPVAF
jgi:glycine cleavage system transcriptional repressor